MCACVRACVCNFNLKILLIATQSFTLSKRSSGDTTLNSLLAQLIQRFADAIASCARAFKIPRANEFLWRHFENSSVCFFNVLSLYDFIK